MAIPKNGYLYAILVTNPGGSGGYFSRHSGQSSGSRLLVDMTVDSLWSDSIAAIAKAKRSRLTMAGATYIVHEFSYALNDINNVTTKWNGNVRIKNDARGQYIVYRYNVYRPQNPRLDSQIHNGSVFTEKLIADKVKICNFWAPPRPCFNLVGIIISDATIERQTRAIKQDFASWLKYCAKSNSHASLTCVVQSSNGFKTTWWNHGSMATLLPPEAPTITIKKTNNESVIVGEAKFSISDKKRPSVECWKQIE